MAVFVTTVTNAELTKCLRQIDAFDGKSRLAVEQALRNGTRRTASEAVRRVSSNSRTGRLAKSIKASFKTTSLVGMVRAKTPYAHLVEFGARPAVIKPKKAKALRIPWEKAPNGYIFAKKAHIPRRAPHPFMIPAFEKEAPNIVKDVKRGIANVKITK